MFYTETAEKNSYILHTNVGHLDGVVHVFVGGGVGTTCIVRQ